MVDSPSGRAPAKAPRWDLVDTEGYGGGNCVSSASWVFSGYVGIYRRKKYVGGCPRGPRDRGAPCRGGRALPSRGRLSCFLACTPSPLDHVRSKNHAPEGFIPFGHPVCSVYMVRFIRFFSLYGINTSVNMV